MENRQKEILKAIIEYFIQTANPVGSKMLCDLKKFPFSPATIRNEMHLLEKEGFLASPHTSAGRIPTTFGYRFFVSDLFSGGIEKYRPLIKKDFERAKKAYFAVKQADAKIFDTVSILSGLTENVAFATIPSSKRTFFLGVSKMLGEPEFSSEPQSASQVFKVLEEKFYDLLSSLELSSDVQVFIGKENILPEIQSCTLLASSYDVHGHHGSIGILGPMRMDFARNILALQEALDFLHGEII